jgi:hypothetical protein
MSNHLFRAYCYQPDQPKPAAYFIESTAADDIDATLADPAAVQGVDPIEDPDDGIKEIARHLVSSRNPVIAVHGFNNSRQAVLSRYKAAFDMVYSDDTEFASDPVCVGYRWPSEAVGTKAVIRTWRQAPT